MPDDLQAALDAALADTKTFSFDVKTFEKHLAEGDIVNLVIRSHLYLEHVVIQSLSDAFVIPEAVDLSRLNFASKIDLCVALGLVPAEWRAAALKVNWMRNQVAHRIDFEFGEDTKRDLWSSLPEFLHEVILRHAELPPERANEVNYRLIFMGFIIWLDIARQKANAERVEGKFSSEYLRRVLDEVGYGSD